MSLEMMKVKNHLQILLKKDIHDRMRDVSKKIKAQCHELGSDCQCTAFECFKNIHTEGRAQIIHDFNLLQDWNESHLI